MKRLISRVKNSKGFVSIEFIMVAGVVILIAGLIVADLRSVGKKVSDEAILELSGSADERIEQPVD